MAVGTGQVTNVVGEIDGEAEKLTAYKYLSVVWGDLQLVGPTAYSGLREVAGLRSLKTDSVVMLAKGCLFT